MRGKDVLVVGSRARPTPCSVIIESKQTNKRRVAGWKVNRSRLTVKIKHTPFRNRYPSYYRFLRFLFEGQRQWVAGWMAVTVKGELSSQIHPHRPRSGFLSILSYWISNATLFNTPPLLSVSVYRLYPFLVWYNNTKEAKRRKEVQEGEWLCFSTTKKEEKKYRQFAASFNYNSVLWGFSKCYANHKFYLSSNKQFHNINNFTNNPDTCGWAMSL